MRLSFYGFYSAGGAIENGNTSVCLDRAVSRLAASQIICGGSLVRTPSRVGELMRTHRAGDHSHCLHLEAYTSHWDAQPRHDCVVDDAAVRSEIDNIFKPKPCDFVFRTEVGDI